MINAQVASIDAATIQAIEAKFANAFPGITKSSWGQTDAAEKRSLLFQQCQQLIAVDHAHAQLRLNDFPQTRMKPRFPLWTRP